MRESMTYIFITEKTDSDNKLREAVSRLKALLSEGFRFNEDKDRFIIDLKRKSADGKSAFYKNILFKPFSRTEEDNRVLASGKKIAYLFSEGCGYDGFVLKEKRGVYPMTYAETKSLYRH